MSEPVSGLRIALLILPTSGGTENPTTARPFVLETSLGYDGKPLRMLPHSGLTPQNLRRIILIQSKRANVGHIGSSLSVVEILVALYGGVLRIASPSDPDRDRFILSKGHAGLALQAALSLRGWISAEQVNTYCGDN